jgi:uncharacterized protein YbbC (DUF1343 family)
MIACLRAAAQFGRKVVILDRPNPIGGEQVEGHALEPAFRSFVGEVPSVPMRHGMTIGELAGLANDWLEIGCELDVVRMRGWRRAAYWDDLCPQWVAPSPNMQTLATAICYAGTVLFEGTNVSEGRGTTQPFELIGAPFVNPDRLIAWARVHRLGGVHLRPAFFEPTFHKWSHQLCGGVQIHVLDRAEFEPYRTALVLLAAMRRLWPREFQWREPPYEYERKRMPIDLIAGTSAVRLGVAGVESSSPQLGFRRRRGLGARRLDHRRAGTQSSPSHPAPTKSLEATAAADAARFLKERRKFLLYD